jgi:hypothetical protein
MQREIQDALADKILAGEIADGTLSLAPRAALRRAG